MIIGVGEPAQRMLRGPVPADASELDRVHARVSWVPSSAHIRPTTETLQAKAAFLDVLRRTFASMRDAMLHDVFGWEVRATTGGDGDGDGRLEAVAPRDLARPRFVLKRNRFPYQLPDPLHTTHMVLWMLDDEDADHGRDEAGGKGGGRSGLSEEEITELLRQELVVHSGEPKSVVVDFVWYENPKKSLPAEALTGMHHVHVFVHKYV